MVLPLINPEIYAWVILPLLIFLARILDVSMETIRVVFISRGIRLYATVIAFVEIVIWLLAVEVVMRDLSNIGNFLAFTFGFAAGTYIGLLVEERLSIGMVIIRIITTGEPVDAIVSYLRSEDHGVTTLDAKGSRGDVTMIISLVKRRDVSRIIDHITIWNPRAFFSIEDVKNVHEGIFRQRDAGSFPQRLRSQLHPGKRQ
ncbi:MAG: DUF5698 domain-containing protein [Methanoregula sp.]|nr:DUF5698 domain-containing protein [Methanoregula sp.]